MHTILLQMYDGPNKGLLLFFFIIHLERFFFINICSSQSGISPLTSECINTGGMHCSRLWNALRSFEIFPTHYAGEGLSGRGFLHFRARPWANALGQVPLNARTPSPRGLPLYFSSCCRLKGPVATMPRLGDKLQLQPGSLQLNETQKKKLSHQFNLL